jgi:hypothetical protein
MNVHFSPKLQHFFLVLAAAFTLVSAPRTTFAGRFDCGSDIVPIYETATPCGFELAGTEELCGWIPMGTHDSGPLPTLAPPKHLTKPRSTPDEKRSEVQESLAMLAATACRSAGVSVEQIIEPFVMVGPYLENSVASVESFESWWAESLDEMIPKADPLQSQIDAIAAQEPIDVESFGISILVFAAIPEDALATSPSDPNTNKKLGIEIKPLDNLVGSSAIIATIEEDYMPYDLAARDLPLWSVFPVSTQPFCVRNLIEDFDSDSMWRDFDHVVRNSPADDSAQQDTVASEDSVKTRQVDDADHVTEQEDEPRVAAGTAEAELATLGTPTAEPSLAVHETFDTSSFFSHCGSADCMLDEIIWQAEAMIAENSPLRSAIAPKAIGRAIASIISGSTQLVERATVRIANRWPEVETEPERSPAGARLLARAGAIDADNLPMESLTPDHLFEEWSVPIEFPATQIAEVPAGTQLQ